MLAPDERRRRRDNSWIIMGAIIALTVIAVLGLVNGLLNIP